MTAPHDPQASHEFFVAAGGETAHQTSPSGLGVSLSVLPMPDGTVRVVLGVVRDLVSPPLLLGAEITADHARQMGEALTKVAGR